MNAWLGAGWVGTVGAAYADIHADVSCCFYMLLTDRRNKVLPDSATCWSLKFGSSHPIRKKQGIIKIT